MNATNGTELCIIQANPDVTGTGIRASIYALALGSRILEFILSRIAEAEDYKEFHDAVESALGVQGLALLCTAIYQTVRHQLTLFHAICVIHLLALLGITMVSAGQYKGLGMGRLIMTVAITGLAGMGFVGFDAYVWATAPTFGSQVECNASTVYVVFGVSIPATAPIFRWIIIATLSAVPAAVLVMSICTAPCFAWIFWHQRKHPQDWRKTTNQYIEGEGTKESKGTREWVNMLSMVAFDIYAIVSLEQTIGRNHLDPAERDWTFGQLLAVFLLLGVMNELLNLWLADWDRKRKERKEEKEKKDKESHGQQGIQLGVITTSAAPSP